MLLDYEISNCTRRCAACERTLAPGEGCYSTLHLEGGVAVRRDYAPESWSGPPDGAVAWWQSRIPGLESSATKLAPQDVLLNLFVALAAQPAEAEFRYVLGLLLVRRRILKVEETRRRDDGETLTLDCPRREEKYELAVAAPPAERVPQLERRLSELVYGGQE